MRLAVASVALALGCAACGSTSDCTGLGDPGGLAQGAALVRVEVYPAPPATCVGDGVNTGGAGLLRRSEFQAPRGQLALDVPARDVVVHVTAFADAAGARLTGAGCAFTTVSHLGSSCLALELHAAGGSDAAAPGDAAMSQGGQPDLCVATQHTDGYTAWTDCRPAAAPSVETARITCEKVKPATSNCQDMNCPGNNSARAICTHLDGGNCRCWAYVGSDKDGSIAGRVTTQLQGGGCNCPTSTDKTWN